MKKIFFNYSNEPEDVKMMCNLCLHFAVLKDKVELWHKGKILPGDTIDVTIQKNFNDSDAAMHLLSLSYAAEEDCMEYLVKGIKQHKENIPVLLSSFDWESDSNIKQLQERLLPHDHKPIDIHSNYNEMYTEVVRTVKREVLGIKGETKSNTRNFYYILAGASLIAGYFLSNWANNIFGNLGITLAVFSLSVIAALFILRKIIFPTSVSTAKI